jgi:hypothetical protein
MLPKREGGRVLFTSVEVSPYAANERMTMAERARLYLTTKGARKRGVSPLAKNEAKWGQMTMTTSC